MSSNPLTTWITDGASSPDSSPDAPAEGPVVPAPPRPTEDPPTADVSLGDEGDRASRQRLWRLAALPWLAALLLGLAVVAGGRWGPSDVESAVESGGTVDPEGPALGADAEGGRGAEGGAGADEVEGLAAVEAAEAAGADSGAAPPGPAGTPPEGARALPRDMAATAEVATRLALTERTADGDRYVDLVSVDGVSWHDDMAVVTVSLVLLEGRDGTWEHTRPARYAIAVTRQPDGPRALGAPWPLAPRPTPEPAPQVTADPIEAEDLHAALLAALDDAGYRDVTVHGLLPSPASTALLARVQAVAPGAALPHSHDVLLDARPPHHVLGSN